VRRTRAGSKQLGDFDPVTVIGHDDLAAGDAFVVGKEVHRGLGGLVELDDGPRVELQHVAHAHLAGAKFDAQLHAHIQEHLQIRGWASDFVHKSLI